MQKFSLYLVLAMALLFSPASFAHKHHSHLDHVKIDFTTLTDDKVTPEIEEKLIEMSHEVIEGEHTHNFLKGWKQNFNFLQKAKDGYRWVSFHDADIVRNLALDSALLFGLSHTLEVASGPVMVAVGWAYQWPDWLLGLMGAAGATISVPGLDPLCIVVFGLYGKSKNFRERVKWVRLGLVNSTDYVASRAGIKDLLRPLFQRLPLTPHLFSIPNANSVDVASDGTLNISYSFSTKTETIMSAVIKQKNGVAYLSSLKMDLVNASAEDIRELQIYITRFGLNARDIMKDAIKTALGKKKMKGRFYVKDIHSHQQGHVEIQFHDKAIQIKAPRAWGRACSRSLSK